MNQPPGHTAAQRFSKIPRPPERPGPGVLVLNDDPDQLFGRVTVGMIRCERQKRRGQRLRRTLLFTLLVLGVGTAAIFLVGERYAVDWNAFFDWRALRQKLPWSF